MKVVLCGPPRSGKSCLRDGLKAAVNRLTNGDPYCLVLTACPDGEGAWFQDAAYLDEDMARRLKEAYRGRFTPEFVRTRAEWVRSPNLPPLTLVDIGGLPSPENETICAAATHAVLLAREPDQFAEWDDFCRKLGLRVLARLISDHSGTGDRHEFRDGVLTGTVTRLERGDPAGDRPTVARLAAVLVSHAAGG